VAAAGVAALAVFARHERALATAGREPLIDPALLALPGIRRGLAGISALHASYGGLLFTTAVYLQDALHDSPLRSGLTFAGYAAGFAAASIAWTRVPSRWQPRLPQAAFVVFAAVTGRLAWLTNGGGWTWQATALLVIAGAAHGTGFDAIVHRTASGVPAALTDAFSGVLATINQLANHRRHGRRGHHLPVRRGRRRTGADDRGPGRPHRCPRTDGRRPAGSVRRRAAAADSTRMTAAKSTKRLADDLLPERPAQLHVPPAGEPGLNSRGEDRDPVLMRIPEPHRATAGARRYRIGGGGRRSLLGRGLAGRVW